MPFKRGQSGNPRGRPRKGDSLAEAIRARWNRSARQRAVDALAKKASDGDVQAFDALAKRGWPDEAKGELSFNMGGVPDGPTKVIFELHRSS